MKIMQMIFTLHVKIKMLIPYYIISRLLQEQGTKGTRTGTGMDGGDE